MNDDREIENASSDENGIEQAKNIEHSKNAPAVYNRLLERVYLALEGFEEKSWPFIKKKIEEAAEVELAAEEMTKDELNLLQAYLKRDLKDLGYYAHKTGEGVASWLKFDLNILEQRIVDMLKGMADKTRVEQVELNQLLEHGPEDYIAGEVSGVGTLRCLDCGSLVQLTKTAVIEPCHQCNSHYFHRDSRL
ncbi:zinc ribbon-containing protein [Motiliproteus sp. MSK22-1]|uniref:zinc ribbon-containing protein n=1 Tax=Motiliproteus sp. MSK22-1 TaxID=1897630 RepID=UPI0009F92D89|nr:zinc ribbon-containing protein [Motiliproteus sp. MSK22-1]